MIIVKRYTLGFRPGDEGAIQDALEKLARSVRTVEGCEGIDIERHATRPEMLFAERWRDEAAMGASAEMIDKRILADVLRLAEDIRPDVYRLLS
jgi:quinol monooxygenase YgiN